MFSKALNSGDAPLPREGDLYKKITVAGKTFELYYGYYEEFEREYNEPMPLYPDFLRQPHYTDDGEPIVTGMQDACAYYIGKESGDSCASCRHFKSCEELFGICYCPSNKKQRNDTV